MTRRLPGCWLLSTLTGFSPPPPHAAAHCLATSTLTADISEITIICGDYTLAADNGTDIRKMRDHAIHPQWSQRKRGNDIGLIWVSWLHWGNPGGSEGSHGRVCWAEAIMHGCTGLCVTDQCLVCNGVIPPCMVESCRRFQLCIGFANFCGAA